MVFDVLFCIEFPSVIDSVRVFGYDPVSQRDIGGNYQIPLLYSFDNGIVRFIGTGLNDLVVYIG